MSRTALALLSSIAGLGAAQAVPAGPAAEPLAAPTTVTDNAPAGRACTFSGRATGSTRGVSDALGGLQTLVEGWEPILDLAVDGPSAIVEGYRKGDRRIISTLSVEPPAGTCRGVVQGSCKGLLQGAGETLAIDLQGRRLPATMPATGSQGA